MWQEKSSSNVQKAETWPTAFHPWSPSHFWSWITLALLWTHFTLAGKIMLSVKGEFMRWKSLMCCWFSIMGWCLSDLQALREKPTGSNNKRHHLASRTKTLHYNQKYKTMKLRSKVPVDKSQWQHDEDWRVSTRSQKRSNSEDNSTRHVNKASKQQWHVKEWKEWQKTCWFITRVRTWHYSASLTAALTVHCVTSQMLKTWDSDDESPETHPCLNVWHQCSNLCVHTVHTTLVYTVHNTQWMIGCFLAAQQSTWLSRELLRRHSHLFPPQTPLPCPGASIQQRLCGPRPPMPAGKISKCREAKGKSVLKEMKGTSSHRIEWLKNQLTRWTIWSPEFRFGPYLEVGRHPSSTTIDHLICIGTFSMASAGILQKT